MFNCDFFQTAYILVSKYSVTIGNIKNKGVCSDTINWTNNHGYTCAQYALNNWCANGAFIVGWTGDVAIGDDCQTPNVPTEKYPTCADYYNYPGLNCVVCGKCTSGESYLILLSYYIKKENSLSSEYSTNHILSLLVSPTTTEKETTSTPPTTTATVLAPGAPTLSSS